MSVSAWSHTHFIGSHQVCVIVFVVLVHNYQLCGCTIVTMVVLEARGDSISFNILWLKEKRALLRDFSCFWWTNSQETVSGVFWQILKESALTSSKITSARWFKLADCIFTEHKAPLTKMHWAESAYFHLTVVLFFLFRPFHTLLFLVDEGYLVASLPGDCSPAVTRLVRMASPLKRYTADIQLKQSQEKINYLKTIGSVCLIWRYW